MQQPEWLTNIETEEKNLIVHKVSSLLWRYGSLKPQMITDIEENHGLSQQQVIELGQFLTLRMQQNPRDTSPPQQSDRDQQVMSALQQQHRFQPPPSNGFHNSGNMGQMNGQMNGLPNPSSNGFPPNFNGFPHSMPINMMNGGPGIPHKGGQQPDTFIPYGHNVQGLPPPRVGGAPPLLQPAPSVTNPSLPSSQPTNGEIDHSSTVGLKGVAALNALLAYFRALEATPVEEPTSSSGLRKGKWTLEEEEYTWRLVQHFNVGLLPIPEGTTLRSFLSSRLQCDRMRITKKFRGVCFGRKYQPCERNHANLLALVAAEKELNILKARFAMRDEQEQEKKSAMQEEIEACLAAPPSFNTSTMAATTQAVTSSLNGEVNENVSSTEASVDVPPSTAMQSTDNDSGNVPGIGVAGSGVNSISVSGAVSSSGGQVTKKAEKSMSTLQAKRVANLLDRPSEALLLVLGQKYLAQLKKQARALHDSSQKQRESTALVGDAVDVSGPDMEEGEDASPTEETTSSSEKSTTSLKRPMSDDDDAIRVDPENGTESLVPGKRVKVMACTDEDSDAGKLLLGFFNTVNENKKGKIVEGDDSGVVDLKDVKDIAIDQLNAAPKDGQGRHVLVADDSASTRRFLKVQLERNGYIVDTAENGQDALESMKRSTYDIVFMDLEMPIMNGFSCSAAFREWEKNTDRDKRQPICVLSMHSGVKEKEMCAEVGVDFFEAKPARIPGLMKIAELCIKLQNK